MKKSERISKAKKEFRDSKKTVLSRICSNGNCWIRKKEDKEFRKTLSKLSGIIGKTECAEFEEKITKKHRKYYHAT